MSLTIPSSPGLAALKVQKRFGRVMRWSRSPTSTTRLACTTVKRLWRFKHGPPMEDRAATCYLPMAALNRTAKKARGNTRRLLLTRIHPSGRHLYLLRSPIAAAEAAGRREVARAEAVDQVVRVAEGPAAPVEVAQAALVEPVEAAETEVPADQEALAAQVDPAEEAEAVRVAVVPGEAAEAHWPFWIERWAARVPAERAVLEEG